MRIKNIEIDYHIDYVERKVHIKEISASSHSQLLNVIGSDFKEELIEREDLLIEALEFDWYCYGAGGLILVSKEYGLQIIAKEKTSLHIPFLGRYKAK